MVLLIPKENEEEKLAYHVQHIRVSPNIYFKLEKMNYSSPTYSNFRYKLSTVHTQTLSQIIESKPMYIKISEVMI